MTSLSEKGGGTFGGIRLLLCENPLPPIDEAITAAQTEVARSNHYTEPYSAPLRRLISRQIAVPERLPALGPGFLRITTALPEDNRRFVDTLREVLAHA